MTWKRNLLFSLFFFILVGSLIYYVLPRVLSPPLRIDSIPADAYIVPWMRPSPSIKELGLNPQIPGEPPPFNIDIVMAETLKLNMTFGIDILGGTRVVPSTVYLGHDSNLLYVGGKFIGMYTNPATTYERTVPNIFSIFFDVANDGVLRQPESGSRLSVYMQIPELSGSWFYHDMMWLDYSRSYKHGAWILADNYYSQDLKKTLPGFTVGDMIKEYDNSTGTLTILYSRFLQSSVTAEFNALQMRPRERWVMGFHLELGFAINAEPGTDYIDGWPKKTYPYLDNDASWWPKLVIDLTNPPSEFSA